jgi:heme exporter protein D
MNWAEFFNMGGYGLYVWGSYGCTALVLIYNIVSAARKHRSAVKMLREFSHLDEARSE